MKIPNLKVEKSQTALLVQSLKDDLMDVFRDLIPRAKTLADGGTFSAVQSAKIEDVAADIGVVRVAASYHLQVQLYEHYKQYKLNDNPEASTASPYPKETKARLELTVNIPLFGQMKITALIGPGQERLGPNETVISVEGGAGSLWYADAKDIISKVKALNLLTAPTFNEVFDPW